MISASSILQESRQAFGDIILAEIKHAAENGNNEIKVFPQRFAMEYATCSELLTSSSLYGILFDKGCHVKRFVDYFKISWYEDSSYWKITLEVFINRLMDKLHDIISQGRGVTSMTYPSSTLLRASLEVLNENGYRTYISVDAITISWNHSLTLIEMGKQGLMTNLMKKIKEASVKGFTSITVTSEFCDLRSLHDYWFPGSIKENIIKAGYRITRNDSFDVVISWN